MISALILVFTLFALGQFSIAYCRTLLQTYAKVELSTQLAELSGVTAEQLQPSDFGRLMELVRAAPDPRDDASEIRTIGIYYRVVRIVRWAVAPISRTASQWADSELSRCAHFAAVSLDRRLVRTTQ
jgi:hypothetical protein